MTEFTPGPWTVHPSESTVVEIPGGHPSTVFAAYCGTEANARLIAAAPDLLAALEDVMAWLDNWDIPFADDDEWLETSRPKITAAITKARGQ